jgi:hypothetical protein
MAAHLVVSRAVLSSTELVSYISHSFVYTVIISIFFPEDNIKIIAMKTNQ